MILNYLTLTAKELYNEFYDSQLFNPDGQGVYSPDVGRMGKSERRRQLRQIVM